MQYAVKQRYMSCNFDRYVHPMSLSFFLFFRHYHLILQCQFKTNNYERKNNYPMYFAFGSVACSC